MIKIISIIILSLLIVGLYLKQVINSFQLISYDVDQVAFKDLNFNSFKTGESLIKINAKFIVKFTSFFNIKFSELKISLYDNGQLIAKTNKENDSRQITLIKNIPNEIVYSFDIKIVSETAITILKIKEKKPLKLDYQISVKLFNLITYKYNNTYEQA